MVKDRIKRSYDENNGLTFGVCGPKLAGVVAVYSAEGV